MPTKFIYLSSDQPDPATMGGKAAALARLVRSNFPIPPFFALSPLAFDASLTDEQRRSLDATDDVDAIRAIVADVRPSAEVAQAIAETLAGWGGGVQALAVRSSAVDEDGAQHSFAGQLESYLFVAPQHVPDRVAAVWRSGFAERVMRYRLERGMRPRSAAPAVLIQAMVTAETAGVAFGADPVTGRRAIMLVSAVYGLGTALVGGDADADTFRVDRDGRVIDRQIAHKTLRHVPDPASDEGVRAEPVDAALADRPTLDDAALGQIAQLTRRASDHFGQPQDIEWAMADGQLYLLQARPITSLTTVADPDGARAIWDNSNIAESYGGITTPLTFTFARLAYEGVYREFCRIMKVPRHVIETNDAMFSQMLGMVRGRVYYNLGNWYRLLAMLPGYSVNGKFMEQMMGVRDGMPAEFTAAVAQHTWADRQAARLRLGWSAASLAWNHLVLGRKIDAFYARLNDALRPTAPPLTDMRLDQLTAEFRRLQSQLLARWDAPLINDFLAMIFFGTLGKLTTKWCADHPNLQNDLISDEGGIISAEPARRINIMGQHAAADAELTRVLCDDDIATATARIATHEQLGPLYRAYLLKFGDRCLEELKLESPTLDDDPTSLVRAIGHTARRLRSMGDNDPPRERTDTRDRAAAIVAERLNGQRSRRVVFNWVLQNARHRVRDRENLRFERTRLFGRIRRIFVEVGKRLCADGTIDDARDVFHLTLDDILSYSEGTSTCDDLRGLVRLRQQRFRQYEALPVPADRFETRGAVYVGNTFELAATSPAGDTTTLGGLQGIGCCPGIVRGPVRVIRDPRGAHLHSGEIMVAERTDPGWIMLFPAAAGILVERGSLLSHSAIVARELGIPAIVSIPGVTSALTDGQWVEMDGATGHLKRIDAPSSEPTTASEAAV